MTTWKWQERDTPPFDECVLQLPLPRLSKHRLARVEDAFLSEARDHVNVYWNRYPMTLTGLKIDFPVESGLVNPTTIIFDDRT